MKKKGFTLIELLAVIIVIAVIAIITVPTILGVIDKSRKAAYKDSIYGIIDSARIYLATNQEYIKPTEEIEFVCDGINCSRSDNGDNLLFKGEVPRTGSIYLQTDGSVLVESVYNGKYYANNETGEVVITEADTTLTRGELTQALKTLTNRVEVLEKENVQLKSKDITLENQISNLQANTTSIDKVYPVGSIYISTSNVNPGDLFKGTTWERYAENRTLVGTSGTAEQTGGNNNVSNISISHTHSYDKTTSGTYNTVISHSHPYYKLYGHTHGTGTLYAAIASGGTANGTNGIHRIYMSTVTGVSYTANYLSAVHNINYGQASVSEKITQGADIFGNTGTITAEKDNTDATGVTSGSVTMGYQATNTGAMSSNSTINAQDPYITVYMWKRIS